MGLLEDSFWMMIIIAILYFLLTIPTTILMEHIRTMATKLAEMSKTVFDKHFSDKEDKKPITKKKPDASGAVWRTDSNDKTYITEKSIVSLQVDLRESLEQLGVLEGQKSHIEQHKQDIEDGRNHRFRSQKVNVQTTNKPSGQYATQCIVCNHICHEDCRIPDDAGKVGCQAMNRDGYCTQCPRKCRWEKHRNLNYTTKIETTSIETTYTEIKQKYEAKSGRMLSVEGVITCIGYDLKATQIQMITNAHEVAKRLGKLDLQASGYTTSEYFDIMIDSEKKEQRPDAGNRISQLEKLKREAEWMDGNPSQILGEFRSYKAKALYETSDDPSVDAALQDLRSTLT